MRVVADSHAVVWYVQGSPRVSEDAAAALADAEVSDGIVFSVATLVDLWYVTQTTQGVSVDDLAHLRSRLLASPKVDLHPIDDAVADAAISIPRVDGQGSRQRHTRVRLKGLCDGPCGHRR